MDDARKPTRLGGFAALTALAALIPYLNSLGGDYTFDDLWVILDNPLVQDRDPLALLNQVYLPGPVYRPLGLLTFIFNEVIGGNPFGYHVVNVGLHALVSVLVFFLAAHLLESRIGALVAGLLFALHPIHTEAVASIVGRFELLAAASALGSMLAFARSLRAGPGARAWYWLSVLVFALGPFAKENAISALPMLFLIHLWLEPRATWWQRVTILVPHAAALAFYLVVRTEVTGALVLPSQFPLIDNPLAHVPTGVRVRTAIIVLWHYFTLLALPGTLSADYSYNEIEPAIAVADPRLLTALLGFGALTIALLAARRRAPVLLLAAALAAVAIGLTSNLPFAIGTMMGERLLYLPSFAWCLAVAWLAARACAARPALAVSALALVCLAYGARTWDRNRDWRDNTSLFEATVAASPHSARAHYNLGVAYFNAERFDEASIEYRRALEIYPDYADAAFAIGRIYHLRDVLAGAVSWYTKAIALDWGCYRAHARLGEIRLELGENAAAEASFRAGLEAQPGHAGLLLSLAAVRLGQGAPWEAQSLIQRFDQSARIPAPDRDALVALRDSLTRELPS